MPAPSTVQGPPGIRAELIAELIAVRDTVVGPDGTDPALSRALSLEDDAVEMCGAVYALPDQFRERGRSGTPLMWPWPWALFRSGMPRREELLLAAAMLLIAAERIDRSQSREGVRHLQVVDTAGVVGQNVTERTLQQCWVAVVIRDEDGNILVARWADTQAWDLPAGPLRVGEDVCTGVRRVVAETVTLGVSVGWIAGIHSHVRDGMTLVFWARHAAGRAVACGDVQLCQWVTPDVAVRMLWPRGRATARCSADATPSAGRGPRATVGRSPWNR